MKLTRRVLIVDDMEAARTELRELLAVYPDLTVVGEAGNVAEAIELFYELRPDLIFLDVQMPRRDGFSLLPELRPVPDIIFVTAYDEHAVKAFEVNAADFLVKPIHPERLALSLARIVQKPKRKAQPFSSSDAIFLYADHEMRVVRAEDITHIEAQHNYSLVHLVTHKPVMVRRKISEWNRLLPAEVFLRVDRSTILNLSAIKEIVDFPNYCSAVRFNQSSEVIELRLFASRRLRKAVREIPHLRSSEPPLA